MTAIQAALEAAARLIGPCEITEALGSAARPIRALGPPAIAGIRVNSAADIWRELRAL